MNCKLSICTEGIEHSEFCLHYPTYPNGNVSEQCQFCVESGLAEHLRPEQHSNHNPVGLLGQTGEQPNQQDSTEPWDGQNVPNAGTASLIIRCSVTRDNRVNLTVKTFF
jgi:hypothetical protein